MRDQKNIYKPLQLSLDTNIQYLIKHELENALNIFNANGAASILMDSNNGEVISLVSLPDFNINKRVELTDKAFMNKITKGVFELGSIFKTFYYSFGSRGKIVDNETIINDIERKIKCSIRYFRY